MPTTRGWGKPSVTLDDIRRFRQLDSKAPGHPEYHWVSGVETTTGPLGQGVATSVGMAIAEKWLANRYNRPGFDIFDYNIYAVCGDGCMMEGIASEAASLAGHLGLDNLCWIYDNNHITIEGNTQHHLHGGRRGAIPGLRLERLAGRRRQRHRAHRAAPSSLSARRKAGPRSSSWTATSATAPRTNRTPPRRMANRSATRKSVSASAPTAGPRTRSFSCLTACTSTSRPASARAAQKLAGNGRNCSQPIEPSIPDLATEIELMQRRELPAGWDRNLPVFPADAKGIAGRDASGKVLNVLAQNIPWFLGGSADLGPSNKTTLNYRRRGRLPGR